MRNYVIKSFIIFAVIYAFVASVILMMFTWYNASFEKDYASDLGYQQHEIYLNNLEMKYSEDYAYFSSLVDSKTLLQLNTDLDSIDSRDIDFVGFYQINDIGIEINGTTYPFKDQVFFEKNYESNLSFLRLDDVLVGIIDDTLYGAFIYQDVIGLIDADKYMVNLLPLHASNSMIIRQNGFILKSYKETSAIILNDYVSSSTTQLFSDYISEGKSGKQIIYIQNDEYLISFTQVKDLPIYYLTFYKMNDLISSFTNVNLYLSAALVSIGIAFLIANLFTFYTSFVRFTDIENARLKIYLNKRLIITMNHKGKIVNYNRVFRKTILNYRKFKRIKDFKSNQLEEASLLFERVKRGYSFTVELDTVDGSSFVMFLPLRMGIHYVLVGDNLTKDDMLLREYESLALLNTNTKLPNYNFYQQYMKELLEKTDFSKQRHVVVGMNLLDFRSINKLVGEKVANETLVEFVSTVKKSLKGFKYEMFNTYVDNFIVVINEVEKMDEVFDWLETLITYLEASTSLAGTTLQLNLRAGIYELINVVSEDLNAEIIFDRVMIALKHANQATTSKYAVYDMTLRDFVSQRQRLESSLIEAIEKREFVMHLQPQLDTNRGRIVSFEALIRWNNPRYNHISPQEFIRLAEENNLIVRIGQIVMEETAKLAKKLEKYHVTIAMNISPVQMIQKGFVNQLKDILDKYQINPHAIALEVTETFMVNSMQLMSEKLKLLQNLGIDIHLDDFGMGYSSLLYLKDLPINMIKIDKSFIDQITTDKYSKVIVNTIVSLSKNIGVDVIAEGVETEAQKQAVNKAGVSIIQGWLISKAVPYEEALLLLDKYNEKPKK
ncbi:putative bifunctional diguanylate cyclase/phosphodiesterase [Acholeplasma hippikon]|uniref:Bacteriophytochrome cph2 n=1 Tax=Acholeplasma hippikon TaxID=264636 RepID=A0A449BLL6_9MOLU|nr:bifunctional diguanylate cyclase/phosphodiesterase [Acholeplasma hippikon]VEU83322.1 Bacteriophytochrome cph2 [Acholeplasma hippikon]